MESQNPVIKLEFTVKHNVVIKTNMKDRSGVGDLVWDSLFFLLFRHDTFSGKCSQRLFGPQDRSWHSENNNTFKM